MPESYIPLQLPGGGSLMVPPNYVAKAAAAALQPAVIDPNRGKPAFNGVAGMAARGKYGTTFTQGSAMALGTTARTVEKPRQTPAYAFLRAMRDRSMIDGLIISIRLAQMRYVAHRSRNPAVEIGWRVRHRYADDPTFENTPAIIKRGAELEVVLEQALNVMWHPEGFDGMLMTLLEDELVLDRKVMVYENIDRLGRPWGFHLVDPATVKPRIDVLLPVMDALLTQVGPMTPAQMMADINLQQIAAEQVSQATGIDITNAAYVQEIDGRLVAAWTADECEVGIVYTRSELNRWGYGVSVLEQSLWWSLAFILTAQYNADLFRQNYPEAVMFVTGDYDPEGLMAFQKQILGEGSGNWRLPIIPVGDATKAEIQRLRDSPRDMLFSQWLKMLTAFKAACYRMSPDLVNFDLVRGSDQTLFQRGNNEQRLTLSQEEGFHSHLLGIGNFMTRFIRRHDPEFVMEWVGLNVLADAEREGINIQRLAYMLPNEVRAMDGRLGPLTGPDADAGTRLLNPTLAQIRTVDTANQQAALQQQVEVAELQAQSSPPGQQELPPSAGGRPHRPPSGGAPETPVAKSFSLADNLAVLERLRAGQIPLSINRTEPTPTIELEVTV